MITVDESRKSAEAPKEKTFESNENSIAAAEKAPPAQEALYGKAIESFRGAVRRTAERGISPDKVADAGTELEAAGFTLLHPARTEPWGQTVARLQSVEGLVVGISYAPRLHRA